MSRIYHPTNDVIYKDVTTDSDTRLVFFSGLGKTVRSQHEGFIRRFALLNGLNYLALDYDTRTRFSNKKMPYLLDDAVERTALKVTSLPEKKLLLYGTCFGALMAYHMAQLMPEKVKGMVLVAPLIETGKNTLGPHIYNALDGIERLSNFRSLVLHSVQQYGSDIPKGEYQGPITIMHGTRDRLLPVSNSIRLSQRLSRKNVELKTIEGAGHGTANGREMTHSIAALNKYLKQR